MKNTILEIRPSLSANLLEDSPRLIFAALILIFSVIVMAISDNLFWALVILVLIFSAVMLHYYVLLQSCILTVNDTSVQMRLGWLSHTTSTITLRKMESTALHQSLLGRYWNFGRIEFKGTGGTSDFSPTIDNPAQLKSEIERRMEAKVV